MPVRANGDAPACANGIDHASAVTLRMARVVLLSFMCDASLVLYVGRRELTARRVPSFVSEQIQQLAADPRARGVALGRQIRALRLGS